MNPRPARSGPDPELPRWKALGLGASMLAATLAPGVRWLVTGQPDTSVLKELRPQAPAPEAPRWGELTSYSKAVSAWFDDRFPFRRELVRAHNVVDWFVLRTSPSIGMERGKDGWLFLQGEAMNTYRGTRSFSPASLERFAREHLEYADWLAARDCVHLYLPAPDKQGVYPEYLPDWLTVEGRPNRTDQILGALAGSPRTFAVDGRPFANELKSLGFIYYPLGTHWSTAGAFAGYQALAEPLQSLFPAIQPLELEDLDLVGPEQRKEGWMGDTWLERCQIDDLVPQVTVDLVAKRQTYRIVDSWLNPRQLMDGITQNEDRDLPRALLLSDSYGDAIWYFLSHSFSAFQKESHLRFAPELVEQLRPDVVIQLRVERYLYQTLEPHGIPAEDIAQARAWLAAEPVGEPVAGALPLGPEAQDTGLRAPGAGGWLRLERTPGVRGALEVAAGALRLEVSFEAEQRWAFVALGALPAGESIRVRAVGGDGTMELRGWALRR